MANPLGSARVVMVDYETEPDERDRITHDNIFMLWRSTRNAGYIAEAFDVPLDFVRETLSRDEAEPPLHLPEVVAQPHGIKGRPFASR